ncbi:MAG: ribonuclease D [Candidatus Endobugula sp.]|jgi:ribonuclease D
MTTTPTPTIFTAAPDITYQWIDNDAALAELCTSLATQSAIALDTEFVRTRTYYPHIGLLQIADENGVYLIDPLAISNIQPMADVLQNPAIVKVVHACSEDLEVFQYAFGVLPESLFDTQVAAGFAGYGSSIGYANLLREIKKIDIPKQETRSDWLQRPLSDAQLRYAALDVEYLLEIYRGLVEKLQQQQRLLWVESDCQGMIEKLRNTNHENTYYTRVKSAWKLDAEQLTVLAATCRWREGQAKKNDVPRSRILKDVSLFDIALKLPMDMQQLKRIQEISSRFLDVLGTEFLTVVIDTLNDTGYYKEPLNRPLTTSQNTTLKSLKAEVRQVAEDLGLPPELLVRKRDYEALIRSAPQYYLPESLSDWRQDVIGDRLLQKL